MSFFSFSQRNKESYSLVYNIGSGSVSGGIVHFTEKAGVQMLNYNKEVFAFQKDVTPDKHLELLNSSLVSLSKKIQADALKKLNLKNGRSLTIDRIFYIFSSPWCLSQTRVIRIKESKLINITEKYLSKVIETQNAPFQADIAKTGTIIEKKIVQVKINGYAVENIYGKQAKEFELSVFYTVVPEKILKNIKDAVSKTFTTTNVWCHSLSLAVFTNIRNLFPQINDFIHIDISEEITDISVIKNNVIISSASIPFGRNQFIREITSALSVSPEIVDSMMKIHLFKNNDELATLKFGVTLDKSVKNWFTKVNEYFDNFKEKLFVSEPIFLVASNDLSLFIKERLNKKGFEVMFIENKKIKPPLLVGDDLMFKLELMFLDNLYKI